MNDLSWELRLDSAFPALLPDVALFGDIALF